MIPADSLPVIATELLKSQNAAVCLCPTRGMCLWVQFAPHWWLGIVSPWCWAWAHQPLLLCPLGTVLWVLSFKFIMQYYINCFIAIKINSSTCKVIVSDETVIWNCLAQPAFDKPLLHRCFTLFTPLCNVELIPAWNGCNLFFLPFLSILKSSKIAPWKTLQGLCWSIPCSGNLTRPSSPFCAPLFSVCTALEVTPTKATRCVILLSPVAGEKSGIGARKRVWFFRITSWFGIFSFASGTFRALPWAFHPLSRCC